MEPPVEVARSEEARPGLSAKPQPHPTWFDLAAAVAVCWAGKRLTGSCLTVKAARGSNANAKVTLATAGVRVEAKALGLGAGVARGC